jgi:predicted sugar kinase
MFIEIGSPASLPFGLVRLEGEIGPQICLLGVTLQHPPVNLSVQTHPGGLQVSGARADLGYAQAARFLNHHNLPQRAEVEIELAIPSLVGLGSEAMLGLSLAQALAWLNNLPLDDTPALAHAVGLPPQDALEVWGYDRGGLLLVEVGQRENFLPPLQRYEIAHSEQEAWAFVLVLPRVPDDTPETLEADRLKALLEAAPYLSADTGRIVAAELEPALAHNDLTAFGRSLMALQALNDEALARAGVPPAYTSEEQAVLDIICEHGAVAWGRSATGLALYGLVKGARASIDLRHKLRHHLGFFGGRAMATITANTGASYVIKDYDLKAK